MRTLLLGFVGLWLLCAGCATHPPWVPSIVGVWEMTELRIDTMSHMPPVELTNKKDIYTASGIYHDTAADSTQQTDTVTCTYTYENGIVTIFREDGRKKLQAKVMFPSAKIMHIHTEEGDLVVFRKVSDDPDTIPKLAERNVPVKMK